MSVGQVIKKIFIALVVILVYRAVLLIIVAPIGLCFMQYMNHRFSPSVIWVFLVAAATMPFALAVGWMAARFLGGVIPAVLTGLIAATLPWYKLMQKWPARHQGVAATYFVASIALVVVGVCLQRHFSAQPKTDAAGPEQEKETDADGEI